MAFKKLVLPKTPELVAVPVTPALVDTPAPVITDAVSADASADVAVPAGGPHLPELSEKFLLAGKAVFTVSNPKGDHYTFKVRRVESEFPTGSGRMSTTYFVSVKSSTSRFPYGYIGILNVKDGTIKCTAKSEFLPGSKEYTVGTWACGAVINAKMIPDGYHIEHAGHCGKCGKVLTDPESIQRGIGPECWKMLA